MPDGGERLGSGQALVDAAHGGHQRDVPRPHGRRPPSRGGTAAPSTLALDRAQPLVLEEERRVVVLDRGPQERLRVGGVEGATILIPGTPVDPATGLCEWIAPKRPPAPTTERITTGTLTSPRVRKRYFDIWFTTLSITSRRKSPNMISTTGRRPVTATEGRPGEGELRDRRVEDALARTSRAAPE